MCLSSFVRPNEKDFYAKYSKKKVITWDWGARGGFGTWMGLKIFFQFLTITILSSIYTEIPTNITSLLTPKRKSLDA